MTRTIQLETGDVTLPTPQRRRFSISNSIVTLTFDGVKAEIQKDDWQALVKQVQTRSLQNANREAVIQQRRMSEDKVRTDANDVFSRNVTFSSFACHSTYSCIRRAPYPRLPKR